MVCVQSVFTLIPIQVNDSERTHGVQCTGVLTKPDALLEGSLGQKEAYLNIVEGRAHQTKHGYFIVRLPDDAERRDGITHSDARIAEAKFFAERKPWATSSHRHRFGVKNLVKSVSEPLTELIRAEWVHFLSLSISFSVLSFYVAVFLAYSGKSLRSVPLVSSS